MKSNLNILKIKQHKIQIVNLTIYPETDTPYSNKPKIYGEPFRVAPQHLWLRFFLKSEYNGIQEKMTREHHRKTKRKINRFKDFFDEDFNWEDKLELLRLKRKLGKPSRGKNRIKKNGFIHSFSSKI